MMTLDDIEISFKTRTKESELFECSSLSELIKKIEFYENKGFFYEPKIDPKTGAEIPGANNSHRGYLSIHEINMILSNKLICGNIRQIEAHNTLKYLQLKNFYQEICGIDEHHLFIPKI